MKTKRIFGTLLFITLVGFVWLLGLLEGEERADFSSECSESDGCT